jgi:hypothetical protein
MTYLITPIMGRDETSTGWRYALPDEVVEVLVRIEKEDDSEEPQVLTAIATVTRADLGPQGQPIIIATVTWPEHLARQSIMFTSSSITRFIKRLTLEELEERARQPRGLSPPNESVNPAFITRPQKGGPWIEIKKPGAKEPLLLCRDSKLAEALVRFLSAVSSAW